MRARSIAAVFVAILLVGSLASCSKKDSGSDDAAVKTEETDASSTTTEDSASNDDSSSADDSSGDDSSGDASADDITGLLGDCGQAAVLYSSLIASSAGLMGGSATDEQVQQLEDQAAELRDDVPEDLQDDMQTVADAYKDFATAIGDGGFMSGDAEDAVEKLDSDEVATAQENLDEYFASC